MFVDSAYHGRSYTCYSGRWGLDMLFLSYLGLMTCRLHFKYLTMGDVFKKMYFEVGNLLYETDVYLVLL